MPDTPPAGDAPAPAGPAVPPAAVPPVATPPVGTPPAAETWFSTFDEETRGHLQNRGWDKLTPDKAAAEAVKAHRNAEHKLGIPSDRILRLPEKLEGADMAPIYDRLGRPQSPKDYAIDVVPEGREKDDAFVEWGRKTFHKLGLSKAQGEALAKDWNEYAVAQITGMQTATAGEIERDVADLKKEQGAAYEQFVSIADRATGALGISPEEAQGIRAIIGTKRAMTLFNEIGTKVMEDGFQSSGQGGGLSGKIRTPEQARAEMTDLRNDADFRKKLISGDTEAQRRWALLNEQAVAGAP